MSEDLEVLVLNSTESFFLPIGRRVDDLRCPQAPDSAAVAELL